MAKNSTTSGLVAGSLGAGAFLVFFLVLSLPWWLALGIALASALAGFLLVPEGRDHNEDTTLAEGRKKLGALRRQARSLAPEVAREAEAVADVAARILDEAASDPRSLKKARPFLSYYLDSTVKILDLYTGLRAQTTDTDIAQTLRRVESMLQTLRQAFETLLARLLADDALDLDTEVALLEQTMKMEGLVDQVPPRSVP